MARRPRKYRLWTAEGKRSICAQTQAPGVSVAQVARRYSMNANLIFKWLKYPRYAPEDIHEAPVFLPVEIGTGWIHISSATLRLTANASIGVL